MSLRKSQNFISEKKALKHLMLLFIEKNRYIFIKLIYE